MHFEEDAVDARRNARRRQRLDVLREPRGHAIATAGQLQTVRHIEHDGHALLAQHREGPHVHHEVVVAERGAALRDDDPRVARVDHLRDRVTHIVRREELAFLDVDDTAGVRRRDEQIGLPAQEGRYLHDVGDRRGSARLGRLVNVGEDRDVEPRLDAGQHTQPLVEPRPAKRSPRGPIRFVERRLEDKRHAQTPGDVHERRRQVAGVALALDDARTGDENKRALAAKRDVAQFHRDHGVHYCKT